MHVNVYEVAIGKVQQNFCKMSSDHAFFTSTLLGISRTLTLLYLICICLKPALALVFCERVDSCSCKFDHNGTVIDLQPLGKTSGGPR